MGLVGESSSSEESASCMGVKSGASSSDSEDELAEGLE